MRVNFNLPPPTFEVACTGRRSEAWGCAYWCCSFLSCLVTVIAVDDVSNHKEWEDMHHLWTQKTTTFVRVEVLRVVIFCVFDDLYWVHQVCTQFIYIYLNELWRVCFFLYVICIFTSSNTLTRTNYWWRFNQSLDNLPPTHPFYFW